MFMERLAWPEVKDHLDREYEAHGGYLPHHAEHEWAPAFGITPASLRKKFNTEIKAVFERSWDYQLSPCDIELIDGRSHAFQAYRRMQARGRSVPPFVVFAQAFHSARLFDINAVMTAIVRNCPKCSRYHYPERSAVPPLLSRPRGASKDLDPGGHRATQRLHDALVPRQRGR